MEGPSGWRTVPVTSSRRRRDGSPSGLAEGHEAEPDPLDVPRREVVEPLAVPRGPRRAVAVRRRSAVADPRLGVLRGVLQLALDHPAVQPAGVEPRPHPLVPLLAAPHLPVAQQLRHPPGREHRADALDELAHDRVAGAPAVAVLVRRHPRRPRRDDERRVAHDEVEALVGDRLEHRPLAEIELHPGERRVEPCERERAPGDVGADHPARVRGTRAGPGSRSRCRGPARGRGRRGRSPAPAWSRPRRRRARGRCAGPSRWPARRGPTRSTSRPRRRRRPPRTDAGRPAHARRRRRTPPGPGARRPRP